MNCSPPGPSVYGMLLTRNTGVDSYSFLPGVFPTQGPTCVTCIAGRFFTVWATREAPSQGQTEKKEGLWGKSLRIQHSSNKILARLMRNFGSKVITQKNPIFHRIGPALVSILFLVISCRHPMGSIGSEQTAHSKTSNFVTKLKILFYSFPVVIVSNEKLTEF